MALRVDTANKRPGEPPIRPKHIVSPSRLKGARLGRGRGGGASPEREAGRARAALASRVGPGGRRQKQSGTSLDQASFH